MHLSKKLTSPGASLNLASRGVHDTNRVLVADDSEVVRYTICAYLESDGIENVALSPDLPKALEFVEDDGPFDLVLLDFNMPGMDGLQGLRKMITANQGKPVGLISDGLSFDLVEEAMIHGASGYIPKELEAREITQAIRSMARGTTFHPQYFLSRTQQQH